ncbi:cellulose biosynthesis protein BcsP [Comamonas composti]|uniref:cellulose biosynthesis protein BcsP n=1 Tax=Comamonas composti TaxID=408558 RepID=UPI000420C78D|nr:cellulose biosynthesis protein BcsP [Comamonas composti]
MQQADDIVGLYQEFGGQANSYRELARTQDVASARARWPLISTLAARAEMNDVPAVQPGEDVRSLSSTWHAAVIQSSELIPEPAEPEFSPALPMPAMAPAVVLSGPAPSEPEAAPADQAVQAAPASTGMRAEVQSPAEAVSVKARKPAKGLEGTSPLAMLIKRDDATEPQEAEKPQESQSGPLHLSQLFSQLLGAGTRP